MAKALRTAALVVGAVALVATGVGAIGAIAAGTAISAGIASASVLGLSVGALGAISAGLSVAAGLLAKKPGSIGGGSQTEFRADPRAGVPYALGRTGTKGSIVYRRHADGWSNATPNDLMTLVAVLSLGPIHAVESFASDKTVVAFAGGNAVGNYANYMFQQTQLGACPEVSALTVTAGVSTAPDGWTADHKLSGLAAAMWRLRYNAKEKFYQNGVPDPLWVIEAGLCYDPRLDDTYPGGAGDQRWDDEDTWEFSECPYLNGLTWCIGRHHNGKRVAGLGASLDQIVVEQFVEGANIADANGWKVGGVIYSRPDTKWNNLKLILQAGAGEPLRVGARIGCQIDTPRVSLATITIDDIVGDASLATTQPRRARINTVIPRYRSEDHQWEIVPADQVQVADYVTADGDERTREIEYPLVQDVDQAACLARYEIENSREFGPGIFPLKPRWVGYKGGDCLTLNLPDVANQKILLLQREIDPSGGQVTLTVRSETDAKHAAALGQSGTPPPAASVGGYDPSVAEPDLADWAMVGGAITTPSGASAAALIATGSVGNTLADAAIWDYRVYDAGAGPEDDWVAAGVESPQLTRKEIVGIAPDTEYEVSVRYRVRGVIGTRRVLGPETTGATSPAGYNQQLIAGSSTDPAYGLLVAEDAGADVTIAIADHTRIYADKTAAIAAVPDLTGQPYATLLYLYYDDAGRAGGAVTVGATTDASLAGLSDANPSRHALGQILTPAALAADTSGGGVFDTSAVIAGIDWSNLGLF